MVQSATCSDPPSLPPTHRDRISLIENFLDRIDALMADLTNVHDAVVAPPQVNKDTKSRDLPDHALDHIASHRGYARCL